MSQKCSNLLFLVWIKGNEISGIIYLPSLATVHCFKSEFHIMAAYIDQKKKPYKISP